MNVCIEHLQVAWGRVQQGSRAAGIDGITVDLFVGDARSQLQQLLRQLRREQYVAQPAKGFYLPKK
ncbi:MAG: hypothetical protein AAFY20_27835, partial [Cyanobacteria bacterium J06639_14]